MGSETTKYIIYYKISIKNSGKIIKIVKNVSTFSEKGILIAFKNGLHAYRDYWLVDRYKVEECEPTEEEWILYGDSDG